MKGFCQVHKHTEGLFTPGAGRTYQGMWTPQASPYYRAWSRGIGQKDSRAPCHPCLASGFRRYLGEASLDFPDRAEDAEGSMSPDFVEDLLRVCQLRLWGLSICH